MCLCRHPAHFVRCGVRSAATAQDFYQSLVDQTVGRQLHSVEFAVDSSDTVWRNTFPDGNLLAGVQPEKLSLLLS